MTVPSTTYRNDYTGTAGTLVFPYTFRILDSADIVVTAQYTTGDPVTVTSGFTVSGVGSQSGGNITFSSAPFDDATLVSLTFTRNPADTQTFDIRNQTAIPRAALEDALDRRTMVSLKQQEEIDRSLKIPVSDTGVSVTLPPASQRALKTMAFDASGNAMVGEAPTGGIVSVAMTPVVQASTLAVGRAAMGPWYDVSVDRVFDVMDPAYGAVADGSTDDGAAIIAACNAAQAAGGGEVRFPRGKTLRIFSVGTAYTVLGAFSACNNIFLNGNGCILEIDPARTWTTSYGYIFQFTQCDMWKVDGFTVTGPTNDVSSSTVKGVEFVHLGQLCTNGSMPHNNVQNCLAGVVAQRGSAGQTTGHTLKIGTLNIKNCWYGINCQWEMDGLVCDILRTEDVHRSYFVYGVRNHKVNIISKDHKANNVQLSSAGAYGLENIDVKYQNINTTDSTDAARHIALFVDESAGAVRNININVDINYIAAADSGAGAFLFEHVLSSGNPDTLGRGRIIENLTISGKIKGQSHYNEATIQAYTLGTYTTGDYWRNWKIKDLIMEGTRGFAMALDSLDGDFTIENVKSDTEIGLYLQGSASDNGPTRGRVIVLGGDFPNQYGYVTAQGVAVITDGSATPTVRVGHRDRTFNNRLSGGNQVYTLPAAAIGLRYTFVRFGAVNMDIDPNGTDTILGGGAGKMLYLRNSGNAVTLECVYAGFWQIVNQVGTVSFET